jgi:ferredoxin
MRPAMDIEHPEDRGESRDVRLCLDDSSFVVGSLVKLEACIECNACVDACSSDAVAIED